MQPDSSEQAQPYVAKWRSVDVPPADKELCHIRGNGDHLLMSVPYSAAFKGWVDFFATAAAGHVYGKNNGITDWIPAAEIDFSSGLSDDLE